MASMTDQETISTKDSAPTTENGGENEKVFSNTRLWLPFT